MKKFILPFLFLCAALNAQITIPAVVQRQTDGTNELLTPINAGTGKSIGIHTGGTFRFDSGASFAGSASAFRTAIGAGTSDFDGAFASLSGKPTTLAGYGITDPVVLTSGSYANPSWITSLAWSKIASTPTTLAGYGITDPVVTTAGSYANPAWITSLADSKLTGAYTASGQTLATSRILGRTTAATGAAEELTASAVLDLIGSTRGSVLYRGVSGWSILAPGTSGYVLSSQGAGADPVYVAQTGGGGGGTWGSITGTLSAQTDLQTALDGKQPLASKLTSLGAMTWGTNSIIYSPTSSTVGVITTANSGVLVTSGAGVPSIATDLPTAVTIGGGAIYRAGGTDVAVADGGTGISAGTSGGILGYTASGALASSVALPANAIVLGGGAGATPTPLGSLGTTTTVLHGNAIGAPTFGAVSLTADVSGTLPSANGGTNNAFFAISGPASTVKTFSLPNASATVLTDNAAVTVAQGGSGRQTGTTAYALIATGTTATGAQQTLANGLTTEILVGGGVSALPAWTTATGSGAPVMGTSPAITTSLTTPSTTFALLNTTATTVNAFGGASVALNIGNASGLTSMLGVIGFDGATPSSSTAAIFPAGTTGVSSFRIPHGAAPTSPENGDFWTTSAGGLFGRINGATINYGAATISGLTTTAIVTANGATAVQTPSSTSTMDSSGNMVLAGTLSIGSGATNAGALVLTQGTANSTGTTNITFEAPTSVTSWKRIYPGSVGSTGLLIETVSGTTQTESVGNLTGDITSAGAATTLATVNSNVGSFTNANITVNAKGLITAAANGSGGTGTANVRSITQANSFTIGQAIFNNNGTWTVSDNTASSTAQVDGLVTATGNPFTVTLGGAETTITGLAANTIYYLGTSGAITSTKPTSTTAFLVQVLHTGVAGDGTVEISEPASLALIGANDINAGLTADTSTSLTVTTAMCYITNNNASAVTDNLPSLASAIAANPTKVYYFKNLGAGAVTITRNGSDTIFYLNSGNTTLVLAQGEACQLVATATQWLVF